MALPGIGTAKRAVRKAGARLIGRLGLLPGGVPNRLGEDDQLLGRTLPHTVMVFFADPPGELYQLEQWYATLRDLDRVHRVVLVLQDSRTARLVRRDSGLDAIVVARHNTMDDLLSRSDIKVALYVNHHPENFVNLRFGSMVHASLMHGDSDKAVTVSHQTNAYDFSFVAGQAAVDRMAAFAPFYDAARRCMTVGRPQFDHEPEWVVGPRPRKSTDPMTVLYAPSWEGTDQSSYYGSVLTHGVELVEAFVQAGWRVIYRPHPLTGVRDGEGFGGADRAIRERLASATDGLGHRTDTDVTLLTSFNDADVLVCDVSGVAVDWLAVDRPLFVTEPASPTAVIARSPLLDRVPRVTRSEVADLPAQARQQVVSDPAGPQRKLLVDYYLGDIAPGAATARFIAAVERLMSERAEENSRLARLGDERR